MSPAAFKGMSAALGFPRVSGDEPHLDALMASVLGFSPRERG